MSGVIRGEEQAKPAAAAAPTTPAIRLHKSGVVVPGNGPSMDEPPVPVLQKHGFNGGIGAFNQRAQSVVDSYTQAYGVKPSPGLVFDLAKSPVDTADFSKMFTVPQNPLAAKNRGIAAQYGHNPNAPIISNASDLAKGILHAADMGNYHEYVTQNKDLIHQFSQDKAGAATLTGAILKARRQDALKQVENQVSSGKLSEAEGRQQLQAMGFIPSGFGAGGIIVAKAVGQVADSLVHSPAGLYELGKAAGLDVSDQITHLGSPHPFHGGTSSHARTGEIAKAAVKQTAQDFEHPGRNPGYLFLDVLGMATPVAGAAARVGEAGRVLRAGEGAGAAARALATKPLQRATLNYGGFTEEMPLSQNPLVAAVQKRVIGVRQARANKALQDVPAGLGFLRANVAGDILSEQLSFAKKLGREADARKRVDQTVAMTLQRELDAAAGHGFNQARLVSRTPLKIKGGLTRGEQKAIQVLSWDDPDPLAAERAFHERAIREGIGDPKAHKRQLADLKLAEKVLANPSKRFMRAFNLTKRAAEEQQAMKIRDLGLLAETADGRIAKAGAALRGEFGATAEGSFRPPEQIAAEIRKLEGLLKAKHADEAAQARVNPYSETPVGQKLQRLRQELTDAQARPTPQRVSDQSFYLKTEPRGKSKRLPAESQGYFPNRAGAYGVPLPRDLAELKHAFTAKAIMDGDFRIDATGLASEAYARTVRAVAVKTEHAKLWDVARPYRGEQLGPFETFIRDSQTIPGKLRDVVNRIDEGSFLPADAKSLPDDMRDLIQELYPDPKRITSEDFPHVRVIDRRLLGEGSRLPHQPGLGAKVAQTIQSPFRFTALYLRPAYILNKLGNDAMLWFDQGIHTVPNFIRAMAGDHVVGEENMRTIYELVGAGKSRSYVTSSTGKISNAVAEFWNWLSDRGERATAFIHYADLKGYKWNREDITRLLKDPASRADLREITRRANKSLVEFDNLLPVEKDYIRHWIFVYPWVSRSAVYSIRAILEHPTKTDILSKLGQQEYENDPIFKAAPAWFKRIGYIPIGWSHDGTPKVVNPTSVNTFSTLGDFVAMTRGATVGDKYASAEDFLGPLPTYFIHAASGRDQFGNQYPGSQWLDAAKEVLGGLPQISAWDKAHPKAKKAGASFNLTDRSSLEASLNANLKKTVMSPGWLDGYGTLIGGGALTPRKVNMSALAARYWADQDPQVRHKRELDLLNRALNIQGQALGQDVPQPVREAVRIQSNIDYQYKLHLKNTGRPPTDKERAVFTVNYLKKNGNLPASEAEKALTQLEDEHQASEINRIKNTLLNKYAGGMALRQWDTDVRALASFTPPIFNEKIDRLYTQGLSPQKKFNVSQDKLYEYGRKYVAFMHEAEKLRKSGASPLELKAFQDAHDKPVDGLPSFVRISWANETPQDQQAHIASIVTGSWGDLSAFDKTLLGRPTDPKVTEGWAQFNKFKQQVTDEAARQGRSVPASYWRTLAKYVEKYYDAPGLVKDYDFAQQPPYDRLKMLAPIQKSPNHTQWVQVLNLAKQWSRYLAAKNQDGSHVYNVTQVRQAWQDYVNSKQFQAWLGEHPAFKQELDSYGKNTLTGLIG